jgi:hypothetical protein
MWLRVDFVWSTRRHIPEEGIHSHRREILKSYKIWGSDCGKYREVSSCNLLRINNVSEQSAASLIRFKLSFLWNIGIYIWSYIALHFRSK